MTCPGKTASARIAAAPGSTVGIMTPARYDAVADFYVSGFDSAGDLIGKATKTEQDERLGIRYLHADIAAPGVLGPGGFDAAVCNFGLSDIDDLDAAITEISAALPPGGQFTWSILHPCFTGGKDISGSWPPGGSYYDEGHWMAQERKSSLRRQVGANHRTLSTYLGTLRRHGLWLDQLAEPRPEADWDQAHDADRKPVFLAARFVKLEHGHTCIDARRARSS